MINSICDLFSDREKQLKKQKIIDEKLQNIFSKCPLTVFKLLLLDRQNNREQLSISKSSNIFNILKNAQDNIENIDKYQDELLYILKNHNVCNNLDNFVKKYE